MPEFNLLYDSLIALIAYVCFLVYTLKWIYNSEQSVVPKTSKITWLVSLRLALLAAALYGLCSYYSISLVFPLLTLPLLFLLTLGDSIFGFPFVFLLWVLQQFVLGFPSRNGLFLKPQKIEFCSATENIELSRFIGKQAMTLSVLNPTGDVTIGESVFPATSFDSGYIEPAADVLVTKVINGLFVVRVVCLECGQETS